MKLLHTSDWHLGHRLHEQSQFEEQKLFLDWLLKEIEQQEIDVLLVAGDIYDTGVPATQSQKFYYDFLISLRNTKCKEVFIIGGNHDAPGTLNAPKALLEALQIHVVGKADEEVENEVFMVEKDAEKVIIAAVPYLRDQDIRKAVAGETFDQIGDRYKKALTNHYQKVADYCDSINKENVPVIAMGHLFAIGGTTSESEQSIYIGNLGDIGSGDFSKTFDYIALGHLHKPQKIDKNEFIRYSGSPNVLSFSEVGYDKKVYVLETNENEIQKVEDITIPQFRKVVKVKGDALECISKLQNLTTNEFGLNPWAEVVLKDKEHTKFSEIQKEIKDFPVEVLKVSYEKEQNQAGIEQLIESSKHVKDLSPMEVFKLKCQEQQFDLKNNQEVLDAFSEALSIARGE
ncbi:exonuclease SbcCD subunit D C-terminal domain-containing protein [Aureivirga sp. CE67]|uniref:exonuclease SbcCD subunit D C-terminal domain-containing protein n=1 Tax=Aureivirga sp. CE67 TaxID=1788983 RepID=UPI0018CBCFED|nr:exonuclease SbcCD subunit D C-terminal domain-containing protein [Aureivirga sp. CE67]